MLFLKKKKSLCSSVRQKNISLSTKINQHDKLFNIQKSKDLFPLHCKLINKHVDVTKYSFLHLYTRKRRNDCSLGLTKSSNKWAVYKMHILSKQPREVGHLKVGRALISVWNSSSTFTHKVHRRWSKNQGFIKKIVYCFKIFKTL